MIWAILLKPKPGVPAVHPELPSSPFRLLYMLLTREGLQSQEGLQG